MTPTTKGAIHERSVTHGCDLDRKTCRRPHNGQYSGGQLGAMKVPIFDRHDAKGGDFTATLFFTERPQSQGSDLPTCSQRTWQATEPDLPRSEIG
jgi:hypothetical protein